MSGHPGYKPKTIPEGFRVVDVGEPKKDGDMVFMNNTWSRVYGPVSIHFHFMTYIRKIEPQRAGKDAT